MGTFFKGILQFVLMMLLFAVVVALFSNRYIIAVLPLLVAALYFWLTKVTRTFVGKPLSPIYQLTEGLVKVEGTLRSEDTLVSPFFKEECIGYWYEEGEIWIDDEGDERVTKAKIRADVQSFYISNYSGRIKVNPDGIDLSLLPKKSESIALVNHSERTIKNGDEVYILATAVKNAQHQFELQKVGKNAFNITKKSKIQDAQKAFAIINVLAPYLVLMYLAVNYFLFFAPIKMQVEKSTAFILFSIFGMPLLGVLFGAIGSNMDGSMKTIVSCLAGIFLCVSLLSFPLMCFTFAIKIDFYRIMCMWASIFVFTSLGLLVNHRKLLGTNFGGQNH